MEEHEAGGLLHSLLIPQTPRSGGLKATLATLSGTVSRQASFFLC